MNRLADDTDEIAKHLKALQITRADSSLIAQCAFVTRTADSLVGSALQESCKVCNDPQVACIGCIRRRMGDSSIPTADCPACWQTPSATCPGR